MIVRKEIRQLELSPGDEVVAMCTFRDHIVIVTKLGTIFKVLREQHDA